MAETYVIYRKSDPTVYEALLTPRTAADDFKQFLKSAPGSCFEQRKLANPDLYSDMNDVAYLVLVVSPSSPDDNDKIALMELQSEPFWVLRAIRHATVRPALGGDGVAVSTALPDAAAIFAQMYRFDLSMTPEELERRDFECGQRFEDLISTDGRRLQADYPKELLEVFADEEGQLSFELYLSEDELLELLELMRFNASLRGIDPTLSSFERINRLLAFHKQNRSQQGKP